MVLINSKKTITKAFKKLLIDDEVTAVAISGGFTQFIAGTTSTKRLIVAPCNMFSSTPKTPIIDVSFDKVKLIDVLCSTYYFGYLIIEAAGIKKIIKVGTGSLFDNIDESFKMFSLVTERNPSAAPKYLEGETTEFMFKIKNGGLKITDKSIFILDYGKDCMNINVKEKINIMDLKFIDTYPGTGPNARDTLILKTDKINEVFTIGKVQTSINMANALPQQEAMLNGSADIIFNELLRRNPNAKPSYMGYDENPVVTMRVAHSQVAAFGGGNILRITDKRLIELNKTDNELIVDYSINISDIQRTELTTIKVNSSSEIHKFEVFTANKTYTYFTPAVSSNYGYEVFKLLGKTVENK